VSGNIGVDVDAADVRVLRPGILRRAPDGTILDARSSVTLISTIEHKIVVDTGPTDEGEKIQENLSRAGLQLRDISIVINTHPHPDHTGGNHLFERAAVLCGRQGLLWLAKKAVVTKKYPLVSDDEVLLDERVSLIKTPGHTWDSISVIIRGASSVFSESRETIVIAGDALPTKSNYVKWVLPAVRVCSKESLASMKKIVEISNWVIPGHDEPFRVKDF